MLKKIAIFLILLFVSGCEQIENQAFVIGIGIDKAEDNMIKVTYLIPNPEHATSIEGSSGNVPAREIITMDGNDLMSIKDRINTVVAKNITYDQLQFIAVSEEMAKDRNLIRYMYDTTKDVQIRRDVKFIVTREKTELYFKANQPKLESRMHKYFNFMIDQSNLTGLIPTQSELLQYFRISEVNTDLFLAIYSAVKDNGDTITPSGKNKILAGETPYEGSTNNIQFAGAALFKGGKMVGKIDGEEVRLATLINNTQTKLNTLNSFPDPFNEKYQIAVRLTKLKGADVKMNLKAKQPTIHLTVPILVNVLSDHTMTDYRIKKNRSILKTHLEKNLEKDMTKLIQKTQKEFKAAPFAWSLVARKKFLTLPAYEKYDFASKYPDMKVTVKVNIRIEDYGRQTNVPSIKGLPK